MTLEKIFKNDEASSHQLPKLLKQHNPFKTIEELFVRAGLTKDDAKDFQKCPDSITVKSLNRILSLCEFDLKLVALFDEELEEANVTDNLSDIYIKEEMDWDEELEWEEELEEDNF